MVSQSVDIGFEAGGRAVTVVQWKTKSVRGNAHKDYSSTISSTAKPNSFSSGSKLGPCGAV